MKITIVSLAYNLFFIGLASAFYFVMPQVYSLQSEAFATAYYKCTTCAIAEKNAIDDFKKGEYQIILWGLGDNKFDKEFKSIIADEYKIKAIRGGCVSIPKMDCYNIKMQQLLFNKYGNNFIHKVYKKANHIIYNLYEQRSNRTELY